MKYSLKNQYKHLLKENTINYTKTDLAKFPDLEVYYGNFSEHDLRLWNEKDGSGGRGEYTVASHFLKTSTEDFSRITSKKFFAKLQDPSIFFNSINLSANDSVENIKDNIKKFLNSIGVEVIRHMKDETLNDLNNNTPSPNVVFKINDKDNNESASKFNTSMRLINKKVFLKCIEDERIYKEYNSYFNKNDFGNYDLIKSVTTGGEGSKSTDVFIPVERIKDKFKNILNINENLTIEVKEISSITNTVSGGSGIRLASGSKLAAMKSDIIFCLTIISIITDISLSDVIRISDESSVRYKKEEESKELVSILTSLKNSQVPSSKIQRLTSIISNNYNFFSESCYELIVSSAAPESKKSIAFSALENLNIIFKNLDISERNTITRQNLDNIIGNSINADYLCILNGHDSSVYKNNTNQIGKKQFLLIHKSAFSQILGFSSYQMGGTAYTSIKKKSVIDFLQRFFDPKNEGILHNNISLFNKKKLFLESLKKKIINEGGLAGHMMHPYEALDMTPRQIIDRIKEYSTSQSIIEKVDGQNLFFTVEKDGTLMFARNKEDMTHDDLVAKFTGHGAEKPFIEGGNAIKRGVEQWLQSAGPAAEMEIREIFHPDGETKSFINFEIMHPDKPNQIIYDEKYIVFHSIIDYVDGRKTMYSTNKGQRLEKIIRLMDSGISSAGFTLASNRTVNLNELTNVQIEDYVERIKEVALSLGISEDVTLGEGIERIIKEEIEGLDINLDRETLKKIYDFVLYGEDRQGNKIKSRDFTSSLVKSDKEGLKSLNLTNAQEALKKIQRIISPFKDVFVDLGIDLLKGVKSAYMSNETNQKNIELLRDKLQTAINDLTDYMNEKPENYWEPEVHRLRTHLDKVIDKDISDIVSTAVEGGVYDYQGDLLKVTGGFAPLNQILGAAYRDKKGIFPTFKEKFMKKESNRRSLKGVFNLIF